MSLAPIGIKNLYLQAQSEFVPTDAQFVVHCELPNNQIHNFNGNM